MRWSPKTTLPALIAGLLTVAGAAAAQPGTAAEDSADAIHLLNRATFGIGPGDVADLLAEGRSKWLERQLHPGRIDDPALDRRLAPFARLDGSAADLYAAFPPPQQLGREVAERYGVDPARLREAGGRAALPREGRRELQMRSPRRLQEELATVRLIRSVHSERQLEAVMTEFWFNHFNVHSGKQLTRWLVAAYEREAIRPFVFGRFEDMLLATARHPAMLTYLDNWSSVAPDSMRPREPGPGMRRRRASRGINENYARELLELHTVGVDGGYGQDDVVDLARVLTGWSVVPLGARRPRPPRFEPGTFFFSQPWHDTGAKRVLGLELQPGGGIEEGERVLRMLAGHPSTARFIAHKLVERFVSDAPDPAFVEELVLVWQRTRGDLREVTRTLFSSERFFDPAHRSARVKTPFGLVASTLRATGGEAGYSRRLLETLRDMGHLPYDAAAPTGYPAASEDWVNSGAMLARMNFALEFAAGRIDGVRPGVAPSLHDLLPGQPVDELQRIIGDDVAGDRALGLALGSPEFQRH